VSQVRPTGPEFLRQSGGAIEALCDFAGTGGSFAGCAAAFKAYNPAIQCFVVEPEGAAVLAGNALTNPDHRIQMRKITWHIPLPVLCWLPG
jgi:cysteine synthase A